MSEELKETSSAPVSPCELVAQESQGKSDLSRAFSEDGALKTHVGGQALLEGIMMRGKYNWAVAVREPQGNIYLEEHEFGKTAKKTWAQWPVVRGVVAFVHSLALGYKALEIATMHAFDEETGESFLDVQQRRAAEAGQAGESFEVDNCAQSELAEESTKFSWKDDFGRPEIMIDALGAQRTLEIVTEEAPASDVVAEAECFADDEAFVDDVDVVVAVGGASCDADEGDRTEGEDKGKESSGGGMGHTEVVVSMVMGLVLGVVLFVVLPAALTNLIVGEYDDHTLAWNIVDGFLRVGVFVFYLWLIGRTKDIQRMFGYHGAEHKAIHCYEHGLPLTPENARKFPCLHVRCGTAFLIMVMIIAIFVYTAIPLNPLITAWGVPDGPVKLLLVMFVRILFMPVIAGVSYEITVKWAGSRPDNPLVKVVLWPGMQMQYLTTREPDDGMIECAIAAMKKVLEREEQER